MEKNESSCSILRSLNLDNIEAVVSEAYHQEGAGRPPRKPIGIFKALIASATRCNSELLDRYPTMDFRTRLYRYATENASQSSPKVYKTLKKTKEETGSPILVSVLTTEQIRSLFKGKQLEDSAIIDIYEQIMIHLLKPGNARTMN